MRQPWPADESPAQLACGTWQTFIPIAGREQAIFTIHVELRRLAEAVATAAQAQRLADALESMSDAVLDYRGIEPSARDRLVAWLRSRR